eukprot:TRINITY_DN9672_c0_g1_i5.p1 TRINITY_DN9672_c0_g1~~TRINITY_DN9672_c0_g1_i5.p1  ORF type:complete len:366 (+),score=85.99 TRINITY_DN9672_c0_g1_i5:894-1991(+)
MATRCSLHHQPTTAVEAVHEPEMSQESQTRKFRWTTGSFPNFVQNCRVLVDIIQDVKTEHPEFWNVGGLNSAGYREVRSRLPSQFDPKPSIETMRRKFKELKEAHGAWKVCYSHVQDHHDLIDTEDGQSYGDWFAQSLKHGLEPPENWPTKLSKWNPCWIKTVSAESKSVIRAHGKDHPTWVEVLQTANKSKPLLDNEGFLKFDQLFDQSDATAPIVIDEDVDACIPAADAPAAICFNPESSGDKEEDATLSDDHVQYKARAKRSRAINSGRPSRKRATSADKTKLLAATAIGKLVGVVFRAHERQAAAELQAALEHDPVRLRDAIFTKLIENPQHLSDATRPLVDNWLIDLFERAQEHARSGAS